MAQITYRAYLPVFLQVSRDNREEEHEMLPPVEEQEQLLSVFVSTIEYIAGFGQTADDLLKYIKPLIEVDVAMLLEFFLDQYDSEE